MDFSKISKNKKITLSALAIAINIVGGFIALTFRIPIYMDGLGTVLIAFLFGPKWGALLGLLSASLNGALFDIYSFYFSPAQIILGFMAGNLKGLQSEKLSKKILLTFAVSIPISIVSAVIAAKVFGTVTSSGSSYIVQILRAMGVSDITAVFVVQFITDYADKLFAVLLASKIVNQLKNIKK